MAFIKNIEKRNSGYCFNSKWNSVKENGKECLFGKQITNNINTVNRY